MRKGDVYCDVARRKPSGRLHRHRPGMMGTKTIRIISPCNYKRCPPSPKMEQRKSMPGRNLGLGDKR